MIIILGGAIVALAWGVLRVLNKKSQTLQNMGFGSIMIGLAVSLTANFTDLGSAAMTAVALLAAAGMLVLAIFCVRSLRSPEDGSATRFDLAVIMVAMFAFIVGSVFHG